MRCQHFSDCDPGEKYPEQCRHKATTTVRFSYRNGENTELKHLCEECADYEIKMLNNWGTKYGHSAWRTNN